MARRPGEDEPASHHRPHFGFRSDRTVGATSRIWHDRGGHRRPALPDGRSGAAPDASWAQPRRLGRRALCDDRCVDRPPGADDLGARADVDVALTESVFSLLEGRPSGIQLLRDGQRTNGKHRPQFSTDERLPMSGFQSCRDRRQLVRPVYDADADDRATRSLRSTPTFAATGAASSAPLNSIRQSRHGRRADRPMTSCQSCGRRRYPPGASTASRTSSTTFNSVLATCWWRSATLASTDPS